MKRKSTIILSGLLAFSMAFSMTACGSGNSASETTAAAPAEASADGGAGSGEASDIAEEYHWTAAMTVAETTVNYKIVAKFKELIEDRSGGKITIDMDTGGQLGGDNEMFTSCRDGSIDIITSMSSGLVDFVPEEAVFDLPNLFPDIETMRAVLQGDFMDTMNEYNKAGGFMVLGYSDAGFRQLSSNKAVRTVDDFSGLKLRTMNNKYHMAYWEALGASPLPMDFNEVYMGLSQNTIDGQENPYMNIVGNSFQEVQDYIVETNHLGHIIFVAMNNDLYESLPENVRTLVDECMAEAIEYGNSEADASIEADKQTCIDAGCEIITLSADDLATMQEKAAVVYDMVRADLGDELVDEVLAAVEAAKE